MTWKKLLQDAASLQLEDKLDSTPIAKEETLEKILAAIDGFNTNAKTKKDGYYEEANKDEEFAVNTQAKHSRVIPTRDAGEFEELEAVIEYGIHPKVFDTKPLMRYVDTDGKRHVFVMTGVDKLGTENPKVYVQDVHITRHDNAYNTGIPTYSYDKVYSIPVNEFHNIMSSELNESLLLEITEDAFGDPDDWKQEFLARKSQLGRKFADWKHVNDLEDADPQYALDLYRLMAKDGYNRKEAEFIMWRKKNHRKYTKDQMEEIMNVLRSNPNMPPELAAQQAIENLYDKSLDDEDFELSDLNQSSDSDTLEDEDIEESSLFEVSRSDINRKWHHVYNRLKDQGINPRYMSEFLKWPDVIGEIPEQDIKGKPFRVIGISKDPAQTDKFYIKGLEKGSRPETIDSDSLRKLATNLKHYYESDEAWLWDKASSMYKQRMPLRSIPLGQWRELSKDTIRNILKDIIQSGEFKSEIPGFDLLDKYEDSIKTGKRNPLVGEALRSFDETQTIRERQTKDGPKYYIWDPYEENIEGYTPSVGSGNNKAWSSLKRHTGG